MTSIYAYMKKIVIAIFAAVTLWVTAVDAQARVVEATDTLTVRGVFENLPLKNLDLLRKTTRLDMLDYYDVDSIWQAPNGMEGFSELVKVTPRFLEVKITPVSTLAFNILHSTGKQLIVCLYTVGGNGQAYDTDVTFLDGTLKELPRKKYLKYPEIEDFFNLPDKQTKEKILDLVPFPTIQFVCDPATGDLTATLTVGEFMSREDFDMVKTYMTPPLQYRWTGKGYEKFVKKGENR